VGLQIGVEPRLKSSKRTAQCLPLLGHIMCLANLKFTGMLVFDGMSSSVHAFIRGGLDEADHWCSPGAKGLETLLQ